MFNGLLPKTTFGAGIPDIDAFRAASYLLLISAMFHWSIKKDIKFFSRWIITLLIFYTIVFASVSWSNFSYDKTMLRNLFDGTFIPFFIAVLAFNLFQKESNAKIYVINISIAAFILSLISLFQMILALSTGGEFRSTAMFANPNTLAIILVLAIPCLLYAKENNALPKFFGWVATVSLVTGIICTVSRKGVFTMVLVFCLHSLLKKQYKRFLYLIVAGILVGAFVSSFTVVSGRFERRVMTEAFESKWDMAYAGLKMFITSPLYGLGYEGYKDHYHEYFPKYVRYDAHNIYVTALANYGIIGFIPFLYIFLRPLSASIRILRNKENIIDEHAYNMAIICLTTLIPFMFNGWVAGSLFYSAIEISLFYSNISLFLSVNRKVEKRY
jgi:O-antigen ligase